jgi:hypothetical protein
VIVALASNRRSDSYRTTGEKISVKSTPCICVLPLTTSLAFMECLFIKISFIKPICWFHTNFVFETQLLCLPRDFPRADIGTPSEKVLSYCTSLYWLDASHSFIHVRSNCCDGACTISVFQVWVVREEGSGATSTITPRGRSRRLERRASIAGRRLRQLRRT